MKRRELLVLAALLAGCAKPAPQEKKYKLTGDVVRLDPNTQMATIKGDKIEGWMEAMTMEYPVKDKSEFAKLHEGDRISATVYVSESAYHIGDIQVIGKAK
jgi:Cu/Ag efflux protein CusF